MSVICTHEIFVDSVIDNTTTTISLACCRRLCWSGLPTWPRPCTVCLATRTNYLCRLRAPRPSTTRRVSTATPDSWRSAYRTPPTGSGMKVGHIDTRRSASNAMHGLWDIFPSCTASPFLRLSKEKADSLPVRWRHCAQVHNRLFRSVANAVDRKELNVYRKLVVATDAQRTVNILVASSMHCAFRDKIIDDKWHMNTRVSAWPTFIINAACISCYYRQLLHMVLYPCISSHRCTTTRDDLIQAHRIEEIESEWPRLTFDSLSISAPVYIILIKIQMYIALT